MGIQSIFAGCSSAEPGKRPLQHRKGKPGDPSLSLNDTSVQLTGLPHQHARVASLASASSFKRAIRTVRPRDARVRSNVQIADHLLGAILSRTMEPIVG